MPRDGMRHDGTMMRGLRLVTQFLVVSVAAEAIAFVKPGTTRRYLQGPLSERLLVFYSEGKIVFGENVHARDWHQMPYGAQRAHSFWLLDGKGEPLDFTIPKMRDDANAAPILGYTWDMDGPFMCPDMVGGGNYYSFLPGSNFEEELFIRSAQVHALCGQMQFSASPWRVLSLAGQRIIRNLVKMRQEKFAAKFVELAKECGKTGEPMIRHMDYMFPGNGYGPIRDQFVMGDFLMVAPVVERGAMSRMVLIPPGKWTADDGMSYDLAAGNLYKRYKEYYGI